MQMDDPARRQDTFRFCAGMPGETAPLQRLHLPAKEYPTLQAETLSCLKNSALHQFFTESSPFIHTESLQ